MFDSDNSSITLNSMLERCEGYGPVVRIYDDKRRQGSCLKSRICGVLKGRHLTTRFVFGVRSSIKSGELPKITQPSCLKSRVVKRELPEITNQILGPAPNHVGGASTATTFSVIPNNAIGFSALRTLSRVLYVILGRMSGIRDFRQLWR